MSEIDEKKYTAKDFATDQDIRWCPGCGDYSILAQVQRVLPDLGIPKENLVFISGIGCSARFTYYTDTYGMHSIHGRAAAIATGLKITRPELSVWVVTGDGDSLSIGTNHLVHAIRRNVDVNILLFNNQIYGLTKGQYSPTSETNKDTKSSPYGSIDHPFNPSSLILGADATFYARTMDRDPKHLQAMLRAAEQHSGTSVVEIYQNCNIFNDGAFETFTDKKQRANTTLYLEDGKPLIFGDEDNYGIVLDAYKPRVVSIAENGTDNIWVHDLQDLYKAQILARFFDNPEGLSMGQYLPRPFGVFYTKERMPYDTATNLQLEEVRASKGKGDLDALLSGGSTWTVE